MASNQNDPARPGNELFVRNEYEKALEAYSTAIEKNPDMAKLYSNRALTYLKLERPLHAWKDVDIGLKLDPDNDKLIYRKCKALLALRRFSEAGQFLEESIRRLEQLTKNKDFKALINDMNRLKTEYKYGQFDLLTILEESEKSKFLDNHADYYAWSKIEIRVIEGKERKGLVAKEKIEAGELLIACKAFVCVVNEYEDDGLSMDPAASVLGRRMETLSSTTMVEKTCKKLMDRPDLAEEFCRLYAGPVYGYLEKWTDGESSLVDEDRIRAIICLNQFGGNAKIPRSCTSGSTMREDTGGLWLIPSFISHTCVDTNCFPYFFGDYMFVRTTKSIEKGEQILFPYVSPSVPFEKRQRICRISYGFDCQCRLCVVDRRDPIEIRKRMGKIFEFVDGLFKRMDTHSHTPSDIPTSRILLQELLEIRPQRDLNYLALRLQQALATLSYRENSIESVRLLTECFEIRKSNGELVQALNISKLLHPASRIKGQEEQKKWKMEAGRIAKLCYGDERMADELISVYD